MGFLLGRVLNTMRRPFSVLGDDWVEFLANLVILILATPLYMLSKGFAELWGLIYFAVRCLSPKETLVVVKNENIVSANTLISEVGCYII